MESTRSIAIPQTDAALRRHDTNIFGMWVFLVTELMLFGALFTLYASYRYFYPAAYVAGSLRLNVGLAAVNTAVLIISSLLMALAVHAAQASKRAPTIVCLIGTAAFGILFLLLKAVEYYQHYVDQLMPGIAFTYTGDNAPQVQLFFLLYYAMTAIHAVHLLIGIGLVSAMLLRLWLRPRVAVATAVEMVGLYWHFVDVIWLFLFPLLYLVGRHA
jgi:cytochrome c oxidase subunit III